MAPDIWEDKKRCLILPQKLGDLEKLEYLDGLRNVINKLSTILDMLNATLISETEYESKKLEIIYDFGARKNLPLFDIDFKGVIAP